MCNKLIYTLLLLTIFKLARGQDWIFSDTLWNLYNITETENSYITTSLKSNSAEPKYISYFNNLPIITTLSKKGKLITNNTIQINNKDIFFKGITPLFYLNKDTLLGFSRGFYSTDSCALLLVFYLNSNLNLIGYTSNKINLPIQYWSYKYNDYFKIDINKNGNIYGVTSICNARRDWGDSTLRLDLADPPCFNYHFVMSRNGEILQQNLIQQNITNKPIFNRQEYSVGMQELNSNNYLVFSFNEGSYILNDSLKLISHQTIDNSVYQSQFAQTLKFTRNKFISGTCITIDSSYSKSPNTYSIFHYDYFGIYDIALNGNILKLNKIVPPLPKDTGSATIYEDGELVYSSSNYLKNNLYASLDFVDKDSIFVSYQNAYGQLTVMQLDSNYKIRWHKIINIGEGNINCIKATQDGGCLLAGWSNTLSNNLNYSGILIKLDKNGSVGFSNTNLLDKNTLAVYPNPSDKILNFKLQDKTINAIEIYTLSGQLLLNKRDDVSLEFIDISVLPNGLYLYKIGSKNGQNHFGKFVKGN